jgi:hypothetical protein
MNSTKVKPKHITTIGIFGNFQTKKALSKDDKKFWRMLEEKCRVGTGWIDIINASNVLLWAKNAELIDEYGYNTWMQKL